MQDDKTVMMPKGPLPDKTGQLRSMSIKPELHVSLQDPQSKTIQEFTFTDGFTAGRSLDCNIVINDKEISRRHLKVSKLDSEWWVHDLNSANGIFIHGKKVDQQSKLRFPATILLGNSGFRLCIQNREEADDRASKSFTGSASENTNNPKSTHRNLSKEAIKARLLADEEAEDSGDFTIMVRKLIHEDRTYRGKKYNKVIRLLGILFLVSAALVTYQQIALSNARTLAIDMFYDIKTLEVSLSKSEEMLDKSTEVLDLTLKAVVNQKLTAEQERIEAEKIKIANERKRLALEKKKLQGMKAKYQQYVEEATAYRIRFPTAASYEKELITRVAREFGECELELPDGFVDEVRRFVRYWQESSRMKQAMERLEMNDYAPGILSDLEKAGLPLYFIYLPLQESNYDTQAIGPETPYGVAKGAWQFLATTGQEYGLAPGPLANLREYDELDARFDFNKATRAAAKYLKHIYSTEAEASGLLVMASYNYGHNRVKEMIRKMPDNPRDKNFWKFIQQYEIPKETYDYVFYIFSAAVIGEDPKHFGFKFNPPLSQFTLEQSKG